jgi:hypothetical protein
MAHMGWPILPALPIVPTIHLALKYPGENGSIVTVWEKSSDARRCYQESLKITKSSNNPSNHQEGKGKKMEREDFSLDEGIMMTN